MPESTEEKTTKDRSTFSSMLKNFDQVSYLKMDWLIASIPYFLFIVLIAIVYIWNSHRSVSMERDIVTTNQQLIEAQYYYNASKDSLTHKSRQSAVAAMVDTLQMQELSQPPLTIKSKDNEY